MSTVTLEDARPMLEAEVRKEMATKKVYDLSQAYDDARSKGANLADAAQKAGVPVATVGPVTQQGGGLDNQPVPGLNPRILEEAFALPPGGESELSESGDGEYFAVKVEKVLPPSMPPLAEIRPALVAEWMRQEIAHRIEARANDLSARVKKGEKLDAVAASAGYPVTRLAGLSRQSAGQDPSMPREILGRAFATRPGEVFVGPTTNTYVIGQSSNVRMEATPIAAQATEAQRGQMTQAVFGELGAAAQIAARAKLKATADPAKARAAVGLEPEEAAQKK